MAKATLDLPVNLTAVLDKKSFAKEISAAREIFNNTAKRVTEAMTPSGGAGSHISMRSGGFGVAAIAEEADRALQARLKSISKRSLESAKEFKKSGVYKNITDLITYLNKVNRFDTLYQDIESLAAQTTSNTIDPKVGLSKYGYLQDRASSFIGLLKRFRARFDDKDVVPQVALEEAYMMRDANKISGINNRSALRFAEKKAYEDAALRKALNVTYYDKAYNPFQEANERLGLGIAPTRKTRPTGTAAQADPSAMDFWNTFGVVGVGLANNLDALLSGKLNIREQNTARNEARSQVKKLFGYFEKAGINDKEVIKNLKEIQNSPILSKAGSIISGATGQLGAASIAGATANLLSTYLQSAWSERIPRNVYASEAAQFQRYQAFGKTAGGIGGLIAGAALSSGNPIIAAIGGILGSTLGPLYGKYKETTLQANIKSSSDMMARIRNKSLYGAGYSTYFAKELSDQGIGNGENAMSGLAQNAMTLRARTMLGQVGEMEMLYYSMMPNYYAALMSGVTGPELLRIYQSDLSGITDPSMRYLIGNQIGNQDAFAIANSGYLTNRFYNAATYQAGFFEARAQPMEYGFVTSRNKAALKNVAQDYGEIIRTARNPDNLTFSEEAKRALESLNLFDALLDPVLRVNKGVKTLLSGDEKGWVDSNGKAPITVVVNIDGDEVKRKEYYADDIYLNGYSQIVGD